MTQTQPTGGTISPDQANAIGGWLNYRQTHNADGTPITGGGNGGTTPPATPAPGTTPEQSSAKALIDGALGQYGLSSLSAWAWSKWQNGESIDQIMLELRATPEYKTRFPAMDTLAQRGHAITEAQYINYEQSASALFKAAGLPPSFYDQPDDFARLLINDVALPELQSRVQGAQTAVFSAPQEVRDEMQRLWGVSAGDLTAFWIEPENVLPLIQQKYAAAQAAGYSDITGFGQLTGAQATQVGNMGLTDAQLAQQFGTLASLQPLFTGLQGTTETNLSRDVALGAGFGQNAQDQAEIERRKQERLATFAGGGGVAATQQGVVGAGTAT